MIGGASRRECFNMLYMLYMLQYDTCLLTRPSMLKEERIHHE